MKMKVKNLVLSPAQLIILGFMAIIIAGSILLMLPVSTVGSGHASFMDALFTATSATCVTGLITQDTATYWSAFGQTVILMMIQVGGMGVVTVAVFITKVSGRKIGLMQRTTMQTAISATQTGGIVRMTTFILKMTVIFEMAGAALLAPGFIMEFGVRKGIWYAVFHSISAFCNAGFDLQGVREPFSSLTYYAGNPAVNIILMLLIIIGGIGFASWYDIKEYKYHIHRYHMQTKVVLVTTAVIIILPTLYFYFCEFSSAKWHFDNNGQRLLCSLFQAVTPRTAGFNTVDLTQLKEPGKVLMILLMLIGGSPGSTAGGMKTTTIAVLILSSFAVFRRKPETRCFGRRLEEGAIQTAATVLMMYFSLLFTCGIIISYIEGIPVLSALFETASALATVGLTLGVTTELGAISQCILIGLMFVGRVGALTLIFAAVSDKHPVGSKYPMEKIMVG